MKKNVAKEIVKMAKYRDSKLASLRLSAIQAQKKINKPIEKGESFNLLEGD